MKSTTLSAGVTPLTGPLSAWLSLIKPRISVMVGFMAFVGALLAAGPGASLGSLFEAALWVSCVAGSSCVINQILERDSDALMRRTASRPLVTGRLRVRDAILFGALLGTLGTAGLALRFNLLSALLALATLAAYALVYTPLKRHSTLNTVVGALPGAMPPLLGFAAIAGQVHGWGWYLFAVLFVWQFPHFMAIAWLYREDYARAGMKMLPALPDSAGIAGRQALLYGLALLPISLLPTVQGEAGWVYAAGALVCGLVYVGCAAGFALAETRPRARALVLVSLVYLPALTTIALLDPLVHLTSSL